MRELHTDIAPVPEGHSVARALLGFDEDGDLLIVQCDEHWEPYDYDEPDHLFRGPVQRLVFYRRTEEQMPDITTYFMVNSDNSVSLIDTAAPPPPSVKESEEAFGIYRLVSPFTNHDLTTPFFTKEEAPVKLPADDTPPPTSAEDLAALAYGRVQEMFHNKPTWAPPKTTAVEEEIHLMDYPEFIKKFYEPLDPQKGPSTSTPYAPQELADKAFETNAKKRKDELLAKVLSQPRKSLFDK